MPRKNKTTITLKMNDAGTEWTSVADELPSLQVHHLLPSVCIISLSEALREHYGNPELEITYSVSIHPKHRKMLDELRANEELLAKTREAVERGYRDIAKALTIVRLKQDDIAEILGTSQSQVNKFIKQSATGTGSVRAGLSSGDTTTGRKRS